VPSTVQLLKVPDVGVPRTGVVSEGEVERTALPEPVELVTPVPPLATGSAVPDNVTANVPLEVIGEPPIDKNVGTDIATLVTVPLAPTALTATFLVTPPWTIGTTSVPLRGVVADGSAEIVVFAMPNSIKNSN